MEYRKWHDQYDYDVPTSMRYPRILVHEILQIPANAHPNKAAILYEGKTLTFWELRQLVLRMANALKDLGIKQGDRVGIHLPTCPQYIIASRAVLSLGAIVVNLNPIYPAEELAVVAKQTTITTLITIDKALPHVRLLCRDFKVPRVIVANSSDFSAYGDKPEAVELDEGWHRFSDLLDNCTNTDRVRVKIEPDDPAVIQFTGGTTGIPKGAVLTHANITTATVQVTALYRPRVKLTPVERLSTLIVLPLYHVYGNLISNWALYNCATQILVPQFEINKLMDIIGSVPEITYFPAVPTMISAIVNHPKAKEMEIGKIIGFMNSGAAPCPLDLIEQVKDAGIFITEGWAMSETSCAGISNPVMGLKKVGSIGIPITDTDVKLVDLDEGLREVPQGEPGEIIIKGPQIMKGYWNNPEETANQLKDGWLYTGDVAIMDEDSYIFIVDRKKDMIITGGFNVYPRDIDEVLHQHPKVELAISIGIPDTYRGETVKAFIVLKNGETASQEDIITFCKEKLAPYKVPRIVEFRDSLPQSAVGKILRKTLRDEELAKA
ncbi:MAG: long-chain fatty acid--CoA ligase [Nitrospirota bacterium]|nr:long-chain fatty acid--CoA ligase [Nitrospirota bacterium]